MIEPTDVADTARDTYAAFLKFQQGRVVPERLLLDRAGQLAEMVPHLIAVIDRYQLFERQVRRLTSDEDDLLELPDGAVVTVGAVREALAVLNREASRGQ